MKNAYCHVTLILRYKKYCFPEGRFPFHFTTLNRQPSWHSARRLAQLGFEIDPAMFWPIVTRCDVAHLHTFLYSAQAGWLFPARVHSCGLRHLTRRYVMQSVSGQRVCYLMMVMMDGEQRLYRVANMWIAQYWQLIGIGCDSCLSASGNACWFSPLGLLMTTSVRTV